MRLPPPWGDFPTGFVSSRLWPGGDESVRQPLPDKVTVALAAGDAVQILTPGGGGWGPPANLHA